MNAVTGRRADAAFGAYVFRALERALANGRGPLRERLVGALELAIALIDELVQDQLNAVLHNPRFQRLEATWRGVRYLAGQLLPKDNVKIRVLNIRWRDICRDIERAIEFDQAALFQLIYDQEFGIAGGEPYGLLVVDHEVQHSPSADHPTDDISALKGLAQIAAAAFAPCILGCAPALLEVDRFTGIGATTGFTGVFRKPVYARWRAMQESEDARFVGLTLPHVLMRLPYTDAGRARDRFRFREDVSDPTGDAYLWGSAGFAFAGIVIRAFQRYRWFADIRGARRDSLSGGLVTDLPVHCFATDRDGVAIRISTDVALTETQEIGLSDAGIIPLMKCKDTDYSAFYGNPSLQHYREYKDAAAKVNARLSSMLQYVLCVSRFAHYVKVIGRDKVGSFATPEDCQAHIERWLRNYIDASPDASDEQRARYPLRSARVSVVERPGRPGDYVATVHLQPHFQLDQLISAFELVTEVSARRAA
ncbi:MAG: type VI secretion system contractile sheath large subunit [Alphaproteobacteria bacterium]